MSPLPSALAGASASAAAVYASSGSAWGLTAITVLAVFPSSLFAQGASSGSDVPCAVPMSWSIAGIDSRFDLSRGEAADAAREAAELWERAIGSELFRVGADGFPIGFEFDHRQATVEAQRERQHELDAEQREIETRRIVLMAASEEHDGNLEQYQRDMEAHRRVVRTFNEDVARWSRETDVPPSVEEELARRRGEIDRVSDELQRRQRELNARSEEIRRDVQGFNRRVDRLADLDASLRRDFPPTAMESGRYDEVITRRGSEVVAVERRIRVFQVSGRDDLVLVLAHEFGHALGLGHADGGGAVMSEVFRSGVDLPPGGSVTGVDRRMLERRCPGLVRRR